MSPSLPIETGGEGNRDRSLAGVPVELYPIVLIATALRLFRLESESYWVDEVVSVTTVTSNTPIELLISVPGNDPHPPFYYLLLSGWTALFGTSELATRLLSALAGIATVVVLYGIGRRLFDREVGAIAAVLVAVSPFHVWYAQEVRMYNLLALLTALSVYYFVRIQTDRATDESGFRTEIGYVVSTVLLGYTHVFGLFVILAQNAYVFSRPLVRIVPRSRLTLRRWFELEALTALLLAPWLVKLVRRMLAARAGETTNVSWIPLPTAETVRETFAAYLGAYLFEESFPLLVSLVVVGCLVLALSSGRYVATEPGTSAEADRSEAAGTDRGREIAADRESLPVNAVYLVVLWFVVPILVPIALSHVVTPIFVDRYSIGASLAFFLLIAVGIRTLSRPSLRYVVVGVLLVGLVAPLPTYYQDDQKEQWRGAAADVESAVDGDDVVLVSRPFTERTFGFYFDRSDVPTVRIPPDASGDEIRSAVDGHDDVWIVLSYTSSSTNQRIVDAVANRDDYRGPVEVNRYNGIAVVRLERTSNGG
ncbi:glycosyl transferase family 39 [Haloterrigena turkmenica DSM 5511]|uniref:Glycosyl transferase family 39 n=1 Tax=Haloterrigena turkmenica (strain ATCC 51198 / DSM 5511 / JCM 9101 / NCIMB 13204 / VKM B-1734 / 4k) TaxID=543526 RepID=D2RQZ0_HALTV|nr:glycosyltransferase family 39 protein [Haloterrigena turkmenica]ADB62386.1 glycosyl transferase family 39 [Haloterrigena turkmenica DSM 5511]